jgi:quercetin dioxygenase-like cupin family protein
MTPPGVFVVGLSRWSWPAYIRGVSAADEPRTHTAIEDLAAAVEVQAGAVVSKVIYRDAAVNVTMFGFDAGEGLTEHTASRTAFIEVLDGRLELTVQGTTYDAGPGFWLQMPPGATHALVAREPTRMLLVLVGS